METEDERPDDHQMAMMAVISAMRILSTVNLKGAQENASRAHSVAPFLDPTAYREKGKALQEDEEMMRAARPLWEMADKIKERLIEED